MAWKKKITDTTLDENDFNFAIDEYAEKYDDTLVDRYFQENKQ